MDKENILEQLKIIEKKEKRVGKVENALHDLFDNYYTLLGNKKKVIDLKLILDKVKDKKAVYFCIDEIGKVKRSNLNNNELVGRPRKYFQHITDTDTREKLLAIEEIRKLLNKIIKTPGLGVITAGKNGLESFMGKDDESPNSIEHISLPPLLKQYIEPILKFELYRKSNRNLRMYLKNKYPKECNDKMKNELEEKMGQLIDKLYEYTAGHPRLLKYTLGNLLERSKLDNIDEKLMEDIKPNQLLTILGRYNNKILYQYFLSKVNNALEPIMIQVEDKEDNKLIKGAELLYMFYLLNEGESKSLYLETIQEAFEIGEHFSLYDLFNSIGLSYIESNNDNKEIQVLIPRYITEILESIKIKSFSFDYVRKLMDSKYGIKKEIFGEYISIFFYAETFFEDLEKVEIQMIDGYSRSNDYLNTISQQIGSSQQSRIVLFKNVTNYAIDGLMLKHCDNKLIVHLIQVKSGVTSEKAKISAQIDELEGGIKQPKQESEIHEDLLKNFGLQSKDEIEITYVLISQEKEDIVRKDSFIGYHWIQYEEKNVSGKVLSLTKKAPKSYYIKLKEKQKMMEIKKN